MPLGYIGQLLCRYWVNIVLCLGVSDLLSAVEFLPAKPTRSKLEPYAEAILALRRKRYSYVEIAEFLLEKDQFVVDPSTIWDFVKTQKKRSRSEKGTAPLPDLVVSTEAPAQSAPSHNAPSSKQHRAVYVPPLASPKSFSADALKTNDQMEDT
jgi:hypothetical protein